MNKSDTRPENRLSPNQLQYECIKNLHGLASICFTQPGLALVCSRTNSASIFVLKKKKKKKKKKNPLK